LDKIAKHEAPVTAYDLSLLKGFKNGAKPQILQPFTSKGDIFTLMKNYLEGL
jgi:hypothetical protein